MPDYSLHNGNCLDLLRGLQPGQVHVAITDPPFGTGTYIEDQDPDPQVWAELQRLLPRGPIAVMGYAKQLVRWSRPIALDLIGVIVWHKYNEQTPSPGLTRVHQQIWIFGSSIRQVHADRVRDPYSERSVGDLQHLFGSPSRNESADSLGGRMRKNKRPTPNPEGKRCSDVWRIAVPFAGFNAHRRLHKNQKPDDLLQRLIRLLSNDGDTILDPYMGSGSCGWNALKLGRGFIGAELNQHHFLGAQKRISRAALQPTLALEIDAAEASLEDLEAESEFGLESEA